MDLVMRYVKPLVRGLLPTYANDTTGHMMMTSSHSTNRAHFHSTPQKKGRKRSECHWYRPKNSSKNISQKT